MINHRLYLTSTIVVVCFAVITTSSINQKIWAQEIVKPHGISYVVLSSYEFTVWDAGHCGHNSLGAPNPGIWRKEKREYSKYDHGRLIRKWIATVDVFVRCVKR